MSNETVLLISSASRTPYVRDILDALCYPKSYMMEFRYLPLWLSKSLRDPRSIAKELNNRAGVIVFADIVEGVNGRDYRFYPIRSVTIVEPKFIGPVLYIPMILEEFFDYGGNEDGLSQQWHEEINSLSDVPRVLEQQGRESSFVLKTNIDWKKYRKEPRKTHADWKRAETGWESVVELLATTTVFRESTFYHIESLLDGDGNTLVPVRRGSSAHYEVKFDTLVRLQLFFYHRRAEYIEGRKLKVCANSDLFSGDVGRQVLADYQYSRSEVRLLAKRRFERDVTTIRIEPSAWTPSPRDIQAMINRRIKEVCSDRKLPEDSDPPKEVAEEAATYIHDRLKTADFFAAVPEIIVELSVPWMPIVGAAALLLIGSVLVGLPQESLKFLLQHIGISQIGAVGWAAFLRSIGGLFALAAIVYVFRRWPLK